MNPELALTNRSFDHARTPPGWIFCDESLFHREQQEIFAKSWLCVGHQSRLKAPGDYFLVELGKESVIIMADQSAQPKAFF